MGEWLPLFPKSGFRVAVQAVGPPDCVLLGDFGKSPHLTSVCKEREKPKHVQELSCPEVPAVLCPPPPPQFFSLGLASPGCSLAPEAGLEAKGKPAYPVNTEGSKQAPSGTRV